MGGNWNNAPQIDDDGDGLTYEIEEILGTCDMLNGNGPGTSVGVEGMSCGEYKELFINERIRRDKKNTSLCPQSSWKCNESSENPYPECWHACDSDNDGIRDDIEVWAVKSGCEKNPTSPYYDPGKCQQIPIIGASFGNYFYSLPVSVLDNPEPTIYDTYLELDYFNLAMENENMVLTNDQVTQIKKIHGQYGYICWNGTNPPCDSYLDEQYKINMHIYQSESSDDKFNAPYLTKFAWWAGAPGTLSYFNRKFTENRKFTKIFRYGLTSYERGGQADGRSFIFGNTHKNNNSLKNWNAFALSHEHGHLLSLGDSLPGINIPGVVAYQYPSLMVNFSLNPLQDTLPNTCSPEYNRFSKGLNNLFYSSHYFCDPLYGYAIDEMKPYEYYSTLAGNWLNKKFVYEVRCRRGGVSCPSSDYCCINWNNNADQCESYPPPFNIDNVDSLSLQNPKCPKYGQDNNPQNDRLPDNNDFQQIFTYGKNRLKVLYSDYFQIYADGFNNSNFYNFAGWDFPKEVSSPYEDGMWKINYCFSNTDCRVQDKCLNDFCNTNLDCKNDQECDTQLNRCTCSNDNDCYSTICDTSAGFCSHYPLGTCSCGANTQCYHDLQCISSPTSPAYCETQENRYMKAIKFRGPSYSDKLILKYDNNLNPIGTLKSFSFIFDIYWEGLLQGQQAQYIINSHVLVLKINENGDVSALIPGGNTNPLIYYSIEKRWWYRWTIEYDSTNGKLYFYVEKQYPFYPDHGVEFFKDGCIYNTQLWMGPSPKDINIGHYILDSYNFNGLIDNVSIYNGKRRNINFTKECTSQD